MYKTIKPFEELTYHDDFMFGVVMQDKDICREVLECLLGIKIKRIKYPQPQKSFDPLYASHGIRLDVYVEDGNRIYDVEIQNRDEHDIGKRSRYYQSMMDMDSLLKGQNYEDLKESIVIFLCRFDPFKKRIPCYNVRRICEEDTGVNLDDAALLKVFNCTAYEKVENEGLRAFLKFIQTDEAESDFTRRLDDMVERKKKIEELKQTYLSWGLHDHDVRREGIREGMEKGIEKGAEEKAVDTVRKFLAMNVLSHEQIAQGVGLPLEKVQEIADQLRIQNA